jgi:DNA-binding IscR family transcriptional regulator
VRGAGGGYRFSGNAKRVTLYQVIRIFEDVGDAAQRPEAGDNSEIGQALVQVLSEINEIASATLKSITLSTLLKTMERDQRVFAEAAPKAAGEARERLS